MELQQCDSCVTNIRIYCEYVTYLSGQWSVLTGHRSLQDIIVPAVSVRPLVAVDKPARYLSTFY